MVITSRRLEIREDAGLVYRFLVPLWLSRWPILRKECGSICPRLTRTSVPATAPTVMAGGPINASTRLSRGAYPTTHVFLTQLLFRTTTSGPDHRSASPALTGISAP